MCMSHCDSEGLCYFCSQPEIDDAQAQRREDGGCSPLRERLYMPVDTTTLCTVDGCDQPPLRDQHPGCLRPTFPHPQAEAHSPAQDHEGWWVRISNIPKGTDISNFRDAIMMITQGESEGKGHQPTRVLLRASRGIHPSGELCFGNTEAAVAAIEAIGGRLYSRWWPHINPKAADDNYDDCDPRWVREGDIRALQAQWFDLRMYRHQGPEDSD